MSNQSHHYTSRLTKGDLQTTPAARMPPPFMILALIPLLAFLGYLIISLFMFILILFIALVVACIIYAVLSKVYGEQLHQQKSLQVPSYQHTFTCISRSTNIKTTAMTKVADDDGIIAFIADLALLYARLL